MDTQIESDRRQIEENRQRAEERRQARQAAGDRRRQQEREAFEQQQRFTDRVNRDICRSRGIETATERCLLVQIRL